MRARIFRSSVAALLLAILVVIVFLGLCCGGQYGKYETVEYDFPPALSGKQRIVVWLPPDYPNRGPYPTLYLLHGTGDDENGWRDEAKIDRLMGRLLAESRIAEMIVVMPNLQGRGIAFEKDLLEKVAPYIESHYATRNDGAHRALVGTSFGGWLALKIGLKHPDRFAYVGGISPAMDEGLSLHNCRQLKLLWLSTGDKDQCRLVSESLHARLEKKGIPHVWRMRPGEHDWPLWRDTLPQLAPLLFRNQ